MKEFRERMNALTPEQRRLLSRRLQQRGFAESLSEDRASSKAPSRGAPVSAPARSSWRRSRRVAFSLFFFSEDGSATGADKYGLLFDCARFADRHGFAAIWVPERHFQAFGGLYPNPAVLAAALAAATEKVQIRAGSVVLPLHDPIRVAEEWSVVDNLSHGRVGISFASGWHPRDFVLTAGAYADRKRDTFRHIETVQDLWRGASRSLVGGDGKTHELRILPRPVQRELPTWVTSAGDPETWRSAGRIGANVLTMLATQPLEDLAPKVDVWRRALLDHGHDPERKSVTVMLHTFVGESDDAVKATVRGPMLRYLETYFSQHESISQRGSPYAVHAELSDSERDVLLEFAFERYFDNTALFGTPERCAALVDGLRDLGVDEIACLVDFGVPRPVVLSGLERLCELKRRFEDDDRAGA